MTEAERKRRQAILDEDEKNSKTGINNAEERKRRQAILDADEKNSQKTTSPSVKSSGSGASSAVNKNAQNTKTTTGRRAGIAIESNTGNVRTSRTVQQDINRQELEKSQWARGNTGVKKSQTLATAKDSTEFKKEQKTIDKNIKELNEEKKVLEQKEKKGTVDTAAADKKAKAFVDANRGKETAYLGTASNGSKGKSEFIVTKENPKQTGFDMKEEERKRAEKARLEKLNEEERRNAILSDINADSRENTPAKSVIENNQKQIEKEKQYEIRNAEKYTSTYNAMTADEKALLSYINREEEYQQYVNWAGVASALSGAPGSNAALAGQSAGAMTASQQARQILKNSYGLTDDEIDAAVILHERARNAELSAKQDEQMREFEREHPVLSSVASVPMNVAGGAVSPFAIVEDAKDVARAKSLGMGDIGLDPNNPYNTFGNASQSIRDEFTKTHDLMIGDFDAGDFLYNTAMSGLDSAAASVLPGWGGALVLGSSAATSKANELSQRGIATDKAIFGGIMAGAAETVFEKISIGNLKSFKEVSPKTVGDIVKNIAKSMGVNASEEAATEIANIAYDTLANGGLSQYETTVRYYINEKGMTPDEAKKKAALELAGQIGEAAASGALMGLGFGGAGNAMGAARTASAYSQLGAAMQGQQRAGIIAEGKAAPEGSKASKQALKVSDNIAKKGKTSDYSLGKLAAENAEYTDKSGRFSEIKSVKQLEEVYQNTIRQLNDTMGNTAEARSRKAVIQKEYENAKTALTMKAARENVAKDFAHREQRQIDELKRVEVKHPELIIGDKSVTVSEITGIENGDIRVKTTGGEEISLSQSKARFADADVKRLYDEAAKMNKDTAKVFLESYDGDDVAEYKRAFEYYYNMGKAGTSVQTIREHDGVFGAILTADAQQRIAEAGLMDKEFKSGVTDWSVKNKKSNFYKFEKGVLQAIGEKFGTEFIILDESSDINAKYLTGTNRIVVYRNADGGVMLRSAAHETYHFVENYSAKDAADLRDYVIDALKGKGVNIDEALEKYAKQGYATRDEQISELVADSMFDVFSNEDFIKNLTAKNQTLAKRLANHIGELVQKIHDAVKMLSVRYSNPEIKALMDDAEKLDTIRNMLLEGYKNAGENFKAQKDDVKTEKPKIVNSFASAGAKYTVVYQAESMEREGATREEIWKKLGVIRDAKGMWVYEIDDSEMKIYPNGDARLRNEEGYRRMTELFNKFIFGEKLTDAEQKEYSELQKKYDIQKEIAIDIGDFIVHDKLFEEYPEIEKATFGFDDLISKGKRGYYDKNLNEIVVDNSFKKEINKGQLGKTAIHEIQHAIQHFDGRAGGASIEYWEKKNFEKLREMQNILADKKIERAEFFAKLDNELKARIREVNNADDYDVKDGYTEKDRLQLQLLDDDISGDYLKLLDMDSAIRKFEAEIEYQKKTDNSKVQYYDTAGEIEARETADRLKMTAEERAERMPDLGWNRAVFAEEVKKSYEIKYPEYSKDEIKVNSINLKKMGIVKELTGEEFKKDGTKTLKEKLLEYFDSLNNNVYTEEFGDVSLVPSSIHSETRHGLTFNKIVSFAAIPDVIKNGVVINVEKKANETVSRIVVAAPIKIGKTKYYMGVMLQRDKESQRLYIHDVITEKEDYLASNGNSVTYETEGNSKNLFLTSILRNALLVNDNFMQGFPDDALNTESDEIYSTKQTDPIQAHYAEVMRENRNLKNIISALDEMQYSSARNNIHLDGRDIHNIAGRLLRNASSKYELKTFEDELTAVYDYMANGREVDTEAVFESILGIANRVLEKSKMKDTELHEQYKDVRNFLKSQPIYITPNVKAEIISQFGDYKSFRNLLMGKVNRISTTNTEARTLDEVWKELHEKAPEYFPEDVNELDMPMHLTMFFEAVAPKIVNPYEHYQADIEEAAALLATDIYEKYFEVGRLKSEKDKYRDLMNENLRKLAASKQAMRNEFRKKAAENEQMSFERYKTRVAEYRQRREEGDRRRVLRNQLERNYNYLNRRLMRETDNDHIPENLKPLISAFRSIVPDSNSNFSKSKFAEFENEYRKLENSSAFFDEDMADKIGELAKRVTSGLDAPKMRELNNAELQSLRDISEHMKYVVQNENKLFSDRLKGRIDSFAQEVHAEMESKPESKAQGKGPNAKLRDKLTMGIDSFIKGLTKPEYLFESLGSETLKTLYDEMRRGENTEARILFDAKTAEQDIKKRNGYDNRWANNEVTIKLRSGDLTVTTEQAMALYATSKRNQGLEHMLKGGVIIYATKKDAKGRSQSKRERRVFTEQDILTVKNSLTTNQISYVNEMVDYITNDIGSKRNEISMRLYGIEKYKEKFYFPIKVDKHFLDSSLGKQEVISTTKNQSSSKRTVNKAANPIEINGFTETVNNHIYDSALYCAYVLPIEDFKRVYNFRDKVIEGEGAESLIMKDISIKEDIRRTKGINAIKEIEQFMVALDSGSRYENLMPLSAKLAARAKKTAVMANLSVVVQQPTAVFRAMLYISPKHFTTWASKADIAEMKKWNGCALKKEIGYFDVNMGRTATDFINEYKTDKSIKKDWSLKDRISNGNVMMTIDQAAGWGATKADEMTWGAIWKACKKQTKEMNPELSGDALNRAASEMFQTTISKTQVYDSVFTKPEYMRRKEGFAMMATQFMSEPITSLNMLAESVVKAKEAKGSTQQKEARRFCTRAFACYVTSVVVNSALKSLIYTMRDDDEDKSFLEKYIANVTEGIVTDPIEMFPYVKDIFSIVQGYDLNRTDVAVFASFKDAVDALGSDKKTGFEKVMSVMKAAGQASGIPAYAVLRDAKAIIDIGNKIINGVQNGFEPTTGRGIINELKETFDFIPGVNPDSKYDQLYNAIAEGDKKHYDKVYNNLIAGGKDESTIDGELAKRLAENDGRIAAAYEATANGNTVEASKSISQLKETGYSEDVINKALSRYKNNLTTAAKEDERSFKAAEARYNMDYDEYERIIGEMVRDGYSELIVKDAINSQKIELETKADEFTVDEKDRYTASYDLKNALLNGNSSDVRKVHSKLVASEGKEKADEEVRKYVKSAYKSGAISETEAKRYLTEYKNADDDENDIFWIMEDLKGGDDYQKYGKLYDAIDNGRGLESTVSYYTEHGVSITTIRSNITSEYKPKLTSLTPGTTEYREMYDNVIDAIVATGKTEAEARKQVNKWFK